MRPGWYVRRDMHQTLGFWDGDRWTDQTAPSYHGIATSATTIVTGVVVGGLVLSFLFFVLNLFVRL